MSNHFLESELKCPNCDTPFEIIKEPDIEYEKCPSCNGLFLDTGELNVLTTGHLGDIESSFINPDRRDKNYHYKKCPKCRVEMHKAHFGNYSHIHFDFCSACSGSFMTVSTEKQINDYLRSITANKSDEEYRDFSNGILVRVDIREKSLAISGGNMLKPGYTQQQHLVITVFYKKPLDIDLVITKENILFRILKLIVSKNLEEQQTGNKEFDSIFKIHANNQIKLKRYLTETVILKIIKFVSDSPTIYGIHGVFNMYDDRLTYMEGPYINSPTYKNNDKFNVIIDNLVSIAGSII